MIIYIILLICFIQKLISIFVSLLIKNLINLIFSYFHSKIFFVEFNDFLNFIHLVCIVRLKYLLIILVILSLLKQLIVQV